MLNDGRRKKQDGTYLSSSVFSLPSFSVAIDSPVKMDEAGFLDPFERVGAEGIALPLRQVLREARRPVAVEVREARGESGHRNAGRGSCGDDTPPTGCGPRNLGGDRGIRQQVRERRIARERLADGIEQQRARRETIRAVPDSTRRTPRRHPAWRAQGRGATRRRPRR